MLDDAKVSTFLARARREVDDGLLPAVQVAIGLDGEVVVDETFGAPPETRFVPFSCTKALVGSAAWQLVGEGSLDLSRPVAEYVPAFGTNGKEAVTVEQTLLHVGGFPMAPLGPNRWSTREGRLEAFSRWRLTLVPGETFMYHPTAAHWVVAEIIEALDGRPYADAIQARVTDPLGLPRMLAIPPEEQGDVIDAVGVGEPPTPEEMEEAFGVRIDIGALIPPDVALGALLSLNTPEARTVGVPGGGGVVRAADLALLYQAFLHDPKGLWDPEVLADVTGTVRNTLPDMFGVPANRTRGGLVVRGDDGLGHRRGMGHTASPRAFGHSGAGGQVAFADPETGLSICYLTNGLDQHLIRENRRVTAITSLAAELVA
ncbi:beta-lactamase family protein [Iamia sp. SCSIO 61187]|uniref:serine hydrolase domain-containing protein n=1 Tax=Iamia sp. SCSIO 61187 TaxID=2722752 RepID=UPI001C631B00|nr:serine hydrolase domain-containing protein [Iamia sp. SCSIO 61187]QYG94567.1 beta-lactamase family protein [Iamia sp. SCSIO 61187]